MYTVSTRLKLQGLTLVAETCYRSNAIVSLLDWPIHVVLQSASAADHPIVMNHISSQIRVIVGQKRRKPRPLSHSPNLNREEHWTPDAGCCSVDDF